jgi:hypothetical protein
MGSIATFPAQNSSSQTDDVMPVTYIVLLHRLLGLTRTLPEILTFPLMVALHNTRSSTSEQRALFETAPGP